MAHHHRDLQLHFHLYLAYIFITCSLFIPSSGRPLREEFHPTLVGIIPDDYAGAGERNADFNFQRLVPRRTSSTSMTTTVTESVNVSQDTVEQSPSTTASVTVGVDTLFTTPLDKLSAEESVKKQPEMKISQASSSVSVSMSRTVQMASVASSGGNVRYYNNRPNSLQPLQPPLAHSEVPPPALISTSTQLSTTTNRELLIIIPIITTEPPPTTHSGITRGHISHSANNDTLLDDLAESMENDQQDQWAKVRSTEVETSAAQVRDSSKSQNDVVDTMTPSSSADALMGRKIVGFVNLPRMYLTAAVSAAGSGKSVQDPLETDTHYVYGPIKDVRETLEAYGVPRPETWIIDPSATTQKLSSAASTTLASTTTSTMAPPALDSTVSSPSGTTSTSAKLVKTPEDQYTILEYDDDGIVSMTPLPLPNYDEPPLNFEAAALTQEEGPSNYEGSPSNHVLIAQEKDNAETFSKSSSSNLKVPPSNLELSEIDEDEEEEEKQQIFMMDEDDGPKYHVTDKTPDGYIVGEYGVISRDSGHLRGVRYTAFAGSANPELIQQALKRFLSL